MARTTTARTDAIEAAARLFDRNGYHGAGLAEIPEASGSPRGSFYFHFPGGKEELAVEAVRHNGAQVMAMIEAATAKDPDPVAIVGRVSRALARWLEASDYTQGCAVSNVALETANGLPVLREACQEQYDAWVAALAGPIADTGRSRREATRLARTTLAGLEGAVLLSRASRSTAPLRDVAAVLSEMLRARTSARSRRA
jgi:TetR/AcrR family transcriptional regulator, lmrAB and yxaGH operons repressor